MERRPTEQPEATRVAPPEAATPWSKWGRPPGERARVTGAQGRCESADDEGAVAPEGVAGPDRA